MTPETLTQTPSPGQEHMLLLGLAGCLLLANILTWMVFRLDARRADEGAARVPAATLLLLALLGGAFAAVGAQLLYGRDSSRSFGLALKAIVAVQVLATAAAFVPLDRVSERISALKANALAATGAEAIADEPAKVLPRRFGPGSDQPAKIGLGG